MMIVKILQKCCRKVDGNSSANSASTNFRVQSGMKYRPKDAWEKTKMETTKLEMEILRTISTIKLI